MKKVKRRRNKAVTVRMNETEYADFQNKVEESGLSQQAYIISAVRGATITPSDEIAVLKEISKSEVSAPMLTRWLVLQTDKDTFPAKKPWLVYRISSEI